MTITATMVKELRERSGAGMMDCKKALVDSKGDLEQAIEFLRKSGASKAEKKAGRIAAEGVIAIRENEESLVLIEINCETDFVAKDENFKNFVDFIGQLALDKKITDIDKLKRALSNGESVDEALTQLSAKVGEKIDVRRLAFVEKSAHTVGVYNHGDRIGAVAIASGGKVENVRDIAMHVAASNPLALNEQEIPDSVLQKEREIQLAQASDSGKPPEIVEKMVNGRMKKFLAENTLLGQPFVKDPDCKISEYAKNNDFKLVAFYRFEVGEGIEKRKENFADEVAAQAKNSGN